MNIGHKTQMSFLGKNNAWELRKAETINLHMPSIFRQTKCVDSIVNIMTMFKDVFKAQKVTLFVLDTDLQSSIISKKDKQINFKKLMLNGSDVILAFYSGEDDFHAPIFKSIEEAGSYM